MGANVSRQQTTILNKSVQDILNKYITNVSSKTDTSVYSNQKIQVDLSGSNLTNCPITVAQNANVSASLVANNISDLANTINTDLKNVVMNQVKQQAEQANKGFNVGQVNVSTTVSNVSTIIQQKLQNIVENSISNVVYSSVSNDQVVVVNARKLICKDGPIEVNQKTIVDALSESISSSIVQTIGQSKVGSDLGNAIEQSTKQSNTGFTLDFAGLLILVAVIVIYGIYRLFSGNGSAPNRAGASPNKSGTSPDSASSPVPETPLNRLASVATQALQNHVANTPPASSARFGYSSYADMFFNQRSWS